MSASFIGSQLTKMNCKTSLAVELVCKRHCSYYKADQELFCQGFKVIQDLIERNPESAAFLHSENEKIFTKMISSKNAVRRDG